MATKAKPIPEGYHTVQANLIVRNAAEAIEFYKEAFGAEERFRFEMPGGKIGHAELKIGDSIIMLADEIPQGCCRSPEALGGTAVNIFLYVEDVDAFVNRAVSAGAKVTMPVKDMFWGDRYGQFSDPFGHFWSVATHQEDLPMEEMRRRMDKEMSSAV